MGKIAIQIEESIGVDETINVLSGKRFENVTRTGLLTLLHTGSAVGLEAELFVADRNALESSPIGANDRVPVNPDDLAVDDVEAFQGEKVQLNITNTTAGALTYRAKLTLDDNVAAI